MLPALFLLSIEITFIHVPFKVLSFGNLSKLTLVLTLFLLCLVQKLLFHCDMQQKIPKSNR